MSTTILLVLLFAALCHAVWNAVSKQIEERDSFFTLILGVSVILYLPLAVYLFSTSPFPPAAVKWLLLSTCSEVLYFVALAKAYQTNNLSHAYPVLRGTAPIVTTILSFLFFGATIAWTGVIGIAVIVVGVLMMNQKSFSPKELGSLLTDWSRMKWVFLAGAFSACSSMIDGMGAAMMSGLLFKYVVFIGYVRGEMDDRQKNRDENRLLVTGETVSGPNSSGRAVCVHLQFARGLRHANNAGHVRGICTGDQHRLCHSHRRHLAERAGQYREMGVDHHDSKRRPHYQAELTMSVPRKSKSQTPK
ncbi:EamA family transporter [Brevibacillus borstelensis]|uniref:EamA family transporter n=1 Tax=Brevibacillus borstelensis TaxID=45462 RepID=UPI001FA9E8C4|nr:DMT family transporter [Brevibacillus borstelensis]